MNSDRPTSVEELVINDVDTPGVDPLTSGFRRDEIIGSIASNSSGDLYVGRINTIFKITNGTSRVIANGRRPESGFEKPPLLPFNNICSPIIHGYDYNPNNNRNYYYLENNVSALLKFHTTVSDILVDNLGNIYIIDTDTNRIRKIDIQTNNVSTYAGNGYYGDSRAEPVQLISGDGGPAIDATLGYIYAAAFDNNNNLYILAGGVTSATIRVVDAITGIIRTVAGICNIDARQGQVNDNQLATRVTIVPPNVVTGMVIDNNGNIYFSDNTFGSVRKIDRTTGMITNYAGPEATREVGRDGRSADSESSGDGGLATAATFGVVGKLTMDNNGNLFICDGNRVRVVTPDGIINTIIGGPEPVLGALLSSNVLDITVIQNGTLYVLDKDNNRILKVALPASGGRRRKSKKSRKTRKTKKSRKVRKSRK